MGLDMYLFSKKDMEENSSSEIAYWRKFNALHAWFVHNVQNDVDNCGNYPVTKENLKELLDTLKKITPENTSKTFPVQSGFFFGSTEYDEWYFRNVTETIEKLTDIFEWFDFENDTLIYGSSW